MFFFQNKGTSFDSSVGFICFKILEQLKIVFGFDYLSACVGFIFSENYFL